MVNDHKSPVVDVKFQEFLISNGLNPTATPEPKLAYTGADYVIVAMRINYDSTTNYFATSSAETVIAKVT